MDGEKNGRGREGENRVMDKWIDRERDREGWGGGE